LRTGSRPSILDGVRAPTTTLFDAAAFSRPEDATAFAGNVLESSTEYSLIATDVDGAILLWNEGARRLYGYRAAEILGRSWSVLHTDEEVRDGVLRQMTDRALSAGKWEGEVTRVRNDGSRFTAWVVTTPRRAADGDPLGFLVISHDITERLRLSRELETEEDRLATAAILDVTARKRFEQELRNANIQLEAASRAKDRFLASMSHELRTPLNAILGFTGTLLMGLPGELNEEQAKQLRTVQVNSKHLLSLINDLLDLARIESGKIDIHIEEIDCDGLLEEVALAARPLADEKGIAFAVVTPPDRVQLRADRRAVNQILINLTNNAIKFTDSGGVRLELSQSGAEGARVVRFSVIDSGRGIKASDQETLFVAFEQIVGASGRPFQGTGLGLYICQALAKATGAAITFESEFGRGSTFMLDLHA
jgi:protein-histidine pros-kinase